LERIPKQPGLTTEKTTPDEALIIGKTNAANSAWKHSGMVKTSQLLARLLYRWPPHVQLVQ
jgi:hypothetical protein